jgi:tRNA(Ile)-lysidine synthase
MELMQKTKETITEHAMFSSGDHILIGLSGGPDSVCLAVVLGKLRDEFDLDLSAVYINHCLRPHEVEKEIVFCRQFCDEMSITFHERTINVRKYSEEAGANVQETARNLRYEMYEAVAAETGAEKIALGHNADDQAETVLMRLIRGSGRRGLAGIPPVRGRIIRPLIGMAKKEIEEFLASVEGEVKGRSGQTCITDTSNFKEEYLRNWIRLSLLEEVKKRNPSVVYDICRTAEIIREEDEYLEIQVTKTLMRLISRKSDSHIELFASPLGTLEKPILRRVLRRALDATMGLRGISFTHVEDIIRLIRDGKAGDRIHLPNNVRVVKEYSLLKITADAIVAIVEREIQPPCEVNINEINTVLKASIEKSTDGIIDGRTSVFLDAGGLSFPLKVRSRTDGDFFYPLGFGKKKKLQDFFVDEKVPRDARDRIPVVLSGNDIIWIAGYRADERYKVTEKTEKILKLIIKKVISSQ